MVSVQIYPLMQCLTYESYKVKMKWHTLQIFAVQNSISNIYSKETFPDLNKLEQFHV